MLLFPDKNKSKEGGKGGRPKGGKGGKPKGGDKQPDKQPEPDPDLDKQPEPEPRRSSCKCTPRGTVTLLLFSCINSNIVHLSWVLAIEYTFCLSFVGVPDPDLLPDKKSGQGCAKDTPKPGAKDTLKPGSTGCGQGRGRGRDPDPEPSQSSKHFCVW